jgi:hypothetical protein
MKDQNKAVQTPKATAAMWQHRVLGSTPFNPFKKVDLRCSRTPSENILITYKHSEKMSDFSQLLKDGNLTQ